MRKTTALWSFTLLACLLVSTIAAQAAVRSGTVQGRMFTRQWSASPQAAQAKNWKSRDEYDAFTAMSNEKDPNKKIQLAEAFLQKYSNSDFKDLVYFTEMQTYSSPPLNQTDKAIEAAHKVLGANPSADEQFAALRYVSFVFPFIYKTDLPDATARLAQAESDAKQGLDALQKLQKPANVPDEQFNTAVKGLRAVFNGTIGFVALQRKDYAAAITSYKASSEDDPTSVYTFYRMGLAYLLSKPPDYTHGVWEVARACDLAKQAGDPNAADFEKYLRQTYVNYHGNDEGLDDVLKQAAAFVNPPDGFKVSPMEAPKHTGNPLVDAFNDMTYPLKLGGEMAQKQWDGLKGQPLELGGEVESVQKGTDPGSYLVRVAILDTSKSTPGVYDIEVKDTKQANVKNLAHGDVVRFKGTMDSYTATPNVMLTVVGEITQPDPLPDKPPVKEKPAPPHHHPPAKKTAQ